MTPLSGGWNPQSGKVGQVEGGSSFELEEEKDDELLLDDDVSFFLVK